MTPAAPLNIPTSSNKNVLQKLFWAQIFLLHTHKEEDKFFEIVDGANINEKEIDGAVAQLHNILHPRQQGQRREILIWWRDSSLF